MNYQRELKRCLAALDIIWEQLQGCGIATGCQLTLDFLYIAPNQVEAEDLSRALHPLTTSIECRGLLFKKWYIEGQTQPMTVSKEILEEWVTSMVELGCQHKSQFDGFGAMMPE